MLEKPKAQELVNTAQVCSYLELTPRQVQRLVKEGHLQVAGEKSYKYGNEYFFDRRQVEELAVKLPLIKRRWQEEDSIRHGACNNLRRQQQLLHQKIRIERRKEEFLAGLETFNEERAALFKAAFYLFHLNHYAKSGETYLYDLKEKVLTAIADRYGRSEWLKLRLVLGPPQVELCPRCRERARKKGIPYPDLARQRACPHCRIGPQRWQMAEFIIRDGNHFFCFHTPLASRRLRQLLSQLPLEEIAAEEEGFAYGRAISEAESLAIPLTEVVTALHEFLQSSTSFTGRIVHGQ